MSSRNHRAHPPASFPGRLDVAVSPSTSVRSFERHDCPRLVQQLEPLLMVIATIITARIEAAEQFMVAARASDSAYDIRDLALQIPLPRLYDTDMCFIALAFMAACDSISTLFDGPDIDVEAFLSGIVERSRLVCEGGVSNAGLLQMLIYVDKLYARCPALMLSGRNVARIMAAAYAVAAKVVEGVPCGTTEMARVLGVDWDDLQQLESGFMRLLGYELHVSGEEFAEAVASFTAEALEAVDGVELLKNLRVAGVSGLDQALVVARNWITVDDESVPTTRAYEEEYITLRANISAGQFQGVVESEMPQRIVGLACGQYCMDFFHIGLNVEEEKGRWYATAMCKHEGVERYLRLRSILLNKDLSVTKLSQMRKRQVPFVATPPVQRRRDGEDFLAGLGEHANAIFAEQWRDALGIPEPVVEAVEDAEPDLVPPPSPLRLVGRRRRTGERHFDREREDAEDRHTNHAGAPCTPARLSGGPETDEPSVFEVMDVLEGIWFAPPRYEDLRSELQHLFSISNCRLAGQQHSSR